MRTDSAASCSSYSHIVVARLKQGVDDFNKANPSEQITLQEYFDSYDWYYPTIQPDDFEESMLNDYEIANRDLIVEYETEQGYR